MSAESSSRGKDHHLAATNNSVSRDPKKKNDVVDRAKVKKRKARKRTLFEDCLGGEEVNRSKGKGKCPQERRAPKRRRSEEGNYYSRKFRKTLERSQANSFGFAS